MGEAANSFREHGPKSRAAEPTALPQWAIDRIVRPAVGFVTRLFWRVSFRGLEHVPASGGLVIAANHQTYVDPFWIGIEVKRPTRYLAWDEAFKWPLVGKALELLGSWPVALERGNLSAYRRSLQWLRRGGILMIFPEGGRAYADGAMLRFKVGAARLALEADVPVLPVTIRGGNTIWPRGWRWPRTGRVEIIFHPVRHLQALPGEDARRCARRETEALAAIIASEL